MYRMMLSKPIFSLQALLCALERKPKQAKMKSGHQKVMMAQYTFQALGGLMVSLGVDRRFARFPLFVTLPPWDCRLRRRECSVGLSFSVSPLRCRRGGESVEAASIVLLPDTSVVSSTSSPSYRGSFPVDEGKVLMLAACLR